MGWDTPDVYNDPEHFGLKIVGSVDWDNEDYHFNFTVVWQDPATGQMYYATDSGCSCPSPFEDFTGRDSLAPLDGIQQFIDFTNKQIEEMEKAVDPHYGPSAEDIVRVRGLAGELIQKMRLALRRP